MTWPRWLYRLNDPLDRWFGDDKASHWMGAAFAMCKARDILARMGAPASAAHVRSWIGLVLIILLVEAIEVARWDNWQAKAAPMPWPFMTDKASLKDIAWGLLGAWMATL